jgi:hypothetical protein
LKGVLHLNLLPFILVALQQELQLLMACIYTEKSNCCENLLSSLYHHLC